jgi:transglutaminase-like putative cysteine protease
MKRYLQETELLDFNHPSLEALCQARGWDQCDSGARLQKLYEFVRDEVGFGYNLREVIPASRVLEDGFGQCNTKGILLMALFRKAGYPCRFRAFGVTKQIQAGLMPPSLHRRLPNVIQHSWVEVSVDGNWINVEGYIVDSALISQVQSRFADWQGSFCGFAIAADDLHSLQNLWDGGDTYIQHKAITLEMGAYDSPDDFYAEHSSNVTGLRGLLWRWFYYRPTNRNVIGIRNGTFPNEAERFVRECPEGAIYQ